MAIQYKLRNTHTFNSSSTRLYLEDDSTGYVNRADVALLIVGYYRQSTGRKSVTFDKYDPLTVTVFNAQLFKDGWHEFHMLSFPIYDSSKLATYIPGDSFYSVSSSSVVTVYYNTVTSSNTTKLANVESLLGTIYEVSKSEDEFVVATNTKIMIRVNSLISNLITNNVDFLDKKLVKLKNNYNVLRCIIQGSLYEFARGNKAVAQKNMEFLSTNDYLTI